MMKAMTRVMMTAAAASMAFAPIAAQANTRAGDSTPVYTTASVAQPGMGREAEGESLRGSGILLAILAAAAIIGAIVVVADTEDNGQSPGT